MPKTKHRRKSARGRRRKSANAQWRSRRNSGGQQAQDLRGNLVTIASSLAFKGPK